MPYPITITVQIVGGESAAAVTAALAGIPSNIWVFTISPTAIQGTDWNPETTYGGFPWPVDDYSLCVAKSTEFTGCTAAGIGAPHRASVLDYSTNTPDLTQRIWHELLHGIPFLESADTMHTSEGFIIWMTTNYPDHAFLDDPAHYPNTTEVLLLWDEYLTGQIEISLRSINLGVPTSGGGYVAVPTSRPMVGDRVIGYPLASGGYYAVPISAPRETDTTLGVPYRGGYITTVPLEVFIDLHDFKIVSVFEGATMSVGYGDNIGSTGGTLSWPRFVVATPVTGGFRLTYEDGGGGTYDTYYELTQVTETTMRVIGTMVGYPWWIHHVYYKEILIGTIDNFFGAHSFDVVVTI